jgi:uncharacterized membrane protein
MRTNIEASEETKETSRTEAFSDGVFAVAITLLILNIQAPTAIVSDAQLYTYVANEWQKIFAFVTSFATIGVMWLNHHRMFTYIKRIDNTLLSLNLLLLLIIVFIPYPTSLISLSLLQATVHAPAVLYTATSLLMAIGYNSIWRYASHHNRLISENADQRAVDAVSRQYRYGPLVYLVVFLLAFIYPPASIIACFLLAIFFAIPGRPQPSET